MGAGGFVRAPSPLPHAALALADLEPVRDLHVERLTTALDEAAHRLMGVGFDSFQDDSVAREIAQLTANLRA